MIAGVAGAAAFAVLVAIAVVAIADRIVAPLERRRRALRLRSARWQARRELILEERASR